MLTGLRTHRRDARRRLAADARTRTSSSPTSRPRTARAIEAIVAEHGLTRARLARCGATPWPASRCRPAASRSPRASATCRAWSTALEERLAAHGLAEDEIVIRMTGCPNGCARPYLAEIGLVGKGPGRYNLYLGGAVRRLAPVQALRRGSRARRHHRGARSAVRRLCGGARAGRALRRIRDPRAASWRGPATARFPRQHRSDCRAGNECRSWSAPNEPPSPSRRDAPGAAEAAREAADLPRPGAKAGVIAGGSDGAAWKAELLAAAGARVIVAGRGTRAGASRGRRGERRRRQRSSGAPGAKRIWTGIAMAAARLRSPGAGRAVRAAARAAVRSSTSSTSRRTAISNSARSSTARRWWSASRPTAPRRSSARPSGGGSKRSCRHRSAPGPRRRRASGTASRPSCRPGPRDGDSGRNSST